MKTNNFKDDLLILAESLSGENIEKFVKSTDLYYSLFPLHRYITAHVRNLVKECINSAYLLDEGYLIRDLDFQINIHLRNNILQFLMVHELRIADAAGLLTGDTDQQKRKSFNLLTADPEWIGYFFEKYKYLNERLSKNINYLLLHTEKILTRLNNDYIEVTTFLDIPKEKLMTVDLFLGDLHQSGQSVCKIRWESTAILYKPRRQKIEKEFTELLAYLKQTGEDIPVRIPDFLDMGNYAWVKFVSNEEVKSIEEVDEFFFIHGQALALFHILGSIDVIDDNVIACGKYPTLIDIECLLSRHFPIDRSSAFSNYFEESVTASGILPTLNIGDNLERDYFGGALHSRSREKVNTTVWDALEGMEIKQSVKEIQRVKPENEKHLPIFNGVKYEITDKYLAALSKGFSQTLNFLSRNKEQVWAFIERSSLFKNTAFRVLPHPTAVYDKLNRSLLIPESFESLKTEREVKGILNRTFAFNTKQINKEIIKEIVRQLQDGDIPYFYSYSAANHLYTGEDRIAVNNFFLRSKSCHQGIHDRLMKLDAETIKAQCRIIDGTVNFFFHIKHGKFLGNDKTQYNQFQVQNLSSESLLNGVKVIADHYVSTAFVIDHEVNWLAKNSNQKDQRYEFTPLNQDLYDGLAGISFFLLYTWKQLPDEQYFQLAEQIFLSSKKVFKEQLRHGNLKNLSANEKRGLPVSPLYYPSSILYLMDHFSAVDSKYIDLEFIRLYIGFMEDILDSNRNWDILMGKAGLLELLMNLHANPAFPDFYDLISKLTLDLSGGCVAVSDDAVAWPYTNTVTNEINMLFGGFAHGTAGISLVLAKAANLLKDEDIKGIAIKALNYDRSLFDDNEMLWKDMREPWRVWDSRSWCHGSTGIALSRIYLSSYQQDPHLLTEVKIAAQNVVKGKTESDCLCHGRGSDYEVLTLCAAFVQDESLKEFVSKKMKEVNQKILSNSYQMIYGDGNKMEMLGLFTGLAGIGYSLLRHFDWEGTPSVISLESSSLNLMIAH